MMFRSQQVVIGVCLLAVLLTLCMAKGLKTKTKLSSKKHDLERKARALRPSFVKRTMQAPLINAGGERIDDEYIVKLRVS